MNDLISDTRMEGQILMDGNGIYDKKVDVTRSGAPAERASVS